MKISELFKRCLKIMYTSTPNSGNFATETVNGTLYIYFEHSNGEIDWMNNLDFPIKAYKNEQGAPFYAHRGFLRVFKSIAPYLDSVLEGAHDEEYESIVVVGYSHGAALAVLCHEYLWYNLPNMRQKTLTYAIGTPRVIWKTPHDAPLRWQNLTTVINSGDIVTHLPPRIFGYVHVGKILEIGKKGRYSCTNAHRPENILTELIEYEKNNGH